MDTQFYLDDVVLVPCRIVEINAFMVGDAQMKVCRYKLVPNDLDHATIAFTLDKNTIGMYNKVEKEEN